MCQCVVGGFVGEGFHIA
ncbi:hypothetical protein [Vibrio mimicus]